MIKTTKSLANILLAIGLTIVSLNARALLTTETNCGTMGRPTTSGTTECLYVNGGQQWSATSNATAFASYGVLKISALTGNTNTSSFANARAFF